MPDGSCFGCQRGVAVLICRSGKYFSYSCRFFSDSSMVTPSMPWQMFYESTPLGEMADGSACGSRGRGLGVVGVFETGKEDSSKLVRSSDVAFGELSCHRLSRREHVVSFFCLRNSLLRTQSCLTISRRRDLLGSWVHCDGNCLDVKRFSGTG